MKLWLLEPREDVLNRQEDNPWDCWFDKAFGFVVAAEMEDEARRLATEEGGNEVPYSYELKQQIISQSPWMQPCYTTCVELMPAGRGPGVVIRNFASA
jgi:hypothetical protein